MAQPACARITDCPPQKKEVPDKWQWVGDVETLVIDITHRTYYVEVRYL